MTGSAFNPRGSGNFTACRSLQANVYLFTFGSKHAQLRPRQRVDNVWLREIVITLTGHDQSRGVVARPAGLSVSATVVQLSSLQVKDSHDFETIILR